MSLKRSTLKAMGLTDEQCETIIADHLETVDALKGEISGYRTQAEQNAAAATERDQLRTEYEALKQNGTDAAKIQAEFDAYRTDVENRAINAQKTAAVKKLLHESGVQSDTVVDLLMAKVDLGTVQLDNGNVKDADSFVSGYRQQYGDLFASVSSQGTAPINPPPGNGANLDDMSDEDYYRAKFGRA